LRSPTEPLAVIACGALGGHIRQAAARRGWRMELHCLPALLHNRPDQITPAAERLARAALARGQRVAVAYADCGTYGALDELCTRLGLRRLPGLHCYDVFAGPDRLRAMFSAEPGTYVLTDYLVRSFERTVLAQLGLDRYPQLWPDYFGNYRRLIWLAQHPEPALEAEAQRIAALFGLPLIIIETGTSRLERALARLVGDAHAGADPRLCAQTAATATITDHSRPGAPQQPGTSSRLWPQMAVAATLSAHVHAAPAPATDGH
jgi:hypothetical protein